MYSEIEERLATVAGALIITMATVIIIGGIVGLIGTVLG